jgi:hypothetical protein
MIHSFTVTFGAKYLTGIVTSVPPYETKVNIPPPYVSVTDISYLVGPLVYLLSKFLFITYKRHEHKTSFLLRFLYLHEYLNDINLK